MRFLSVLLILITIFISCCKKNNSDDCNIPAVVPFQPYSNPIWHPNGELLGFNHTPQVEVFVNGTPPCIWYLNSIKSDSLGFYLMKKDGTDLRRVTNFYLNTPSWSPDGNWISFSIPPHIYKMQFDGNMFDTAHIIQLTTTGGNFYPSWDVNSDTIYFDSNVGTNGQGYYIWKMASDGTGKTGFPNTGREPFVGSDGKVYYVGLEGEIYQMNKDGSNRVQQTTNSGGGHSPKYWHGKIFFESGGIKVAQSNGTISLLTSPAVTYDISIIGEIVYCKWDYSVSINDKQRGTLWIMNADGSNKRQLTFNNF